MASIARDAAIFRDEAARAVERFRDQPYRQKMALICRKLGATLEASLGPWRADHRPAPGTYASAAEFMADLLRTSIR